MSDLPYTDEQARTFGSTLSDYFMGVTEPAQREFLRLLHDRGITVTFPEPRYHVVRDTDDSAGTPRWYVRDRTVCANVAWFYGPTSERHAREHADRLNREAQP